MRFQKLILLSFTVLIGGVALADETGSVSGIVRDSSGSALPGVTVSIRGQYLPAGRDMTTEGDGVFVFQRLLPGEYNVTAELAGLGTATRRALVRVDNDTQVVLTLSPAAVSETITVVAAAPVVDVKSTEVSSNFTNEVIQDLPIARSYTGLFQLAPGVADNGRSSLVAGGSFQDNTYLADGINITNPWFGNSVPNITDLDIQEVNIKRGGVSAEFGSTFGMVVNAVTKSGSNDLNGVARFEYAPQDFVADTKAATGSRSQTDRTNTGFSLGGPLLRDRAWFYGSLTLRRDSTTNRLNNLGPVPDKDDDTDEYFGKLTANPWSNHFFSGSYRLRDNQTTNEEITANRAATTGYASEQRFQLATAGWVWNITTRSFLDFKGNYTDQDGGLTPALILGYRPLPFDVNNLDRMGEYTRPDGFIVGAYLDAVNDQDYFRHEARATFQTFQNWLGWTHDLRTGLSFDEGGEDLSRLANGWGQITRTTSGGNLTGYRARIYTPQPLHAASAETWGVFVQDQISIGLRTTVNAGVLANSQEVFGGNGDLVISFDWDQMIQPRLGVSVVPSLDLRDKIYVNFGRYTNLGNLSIGRAGSQTRLYRTDVFFDVQGNFLQEAPQSASRPKRIVQGIDPMYTDEWIAGYARPLNAVWSAEIWGMYRSSHDFVEDMPNDLPPPGFKIDQLPGAKRNYEAVTLEINRTGTDQRWFGLTLNGSYTWSKLYGNWDLDFVGPTAGQFYNSSLLQDGPGLNITDNRSGILQGDRTHVAKLFAALHPFSRFTLGTGLRYQSGIPWEPRAFETANSGRYFTYLEAAGSRRADSWFNADFLASYAFPLGFGDLELEARLINVFDEQAPITIDDRVINETTWAASGDPGNPTFGQPSSTSTPRSLILSASVQF